MIILETPDKIRYGYDFDELTLEQVNSAIRLFEYNNEQIQSPPKNVEQMITGGSIDLVLRAVSFIVSPIDDNEVLEAFRRESAGLTLKALRSMKASQHIKIQEIKADFFAKAGISDVESFTQLKPIIQLFAGLNSAEIRNLQSPAKDAQMNSDESSDSTAQMSGSVDY